MISGSLNAWLIMPDNEMCSFLYRMAADGVVYNAEVSQRLGRTISKEQYAFLYR